ncbi:MAG: alkaline phosphatase [Ideonella sp. MAG2]|nr:MAG: alkaline phosphatase [Ideonella sp. MAG2]
MHTAHPSSRRDCLSLGLGALATCYLPWVRAADVSRFAWGVASGFPQADGMVLWTQLSGPALPDRVDVRWEVATDAQFKNVVARGVEVAEASWGWSVHAEPTGLPPERWFWYRFQALGDQSPAGRTRTAPAPAANAVLKFATASCQRYDMGHYAAWRQVVQDEPDLVIFLGDYIYEYGSRPDALRRHDGGSVSSLEQYRQRYQQYKSDPLLQAAHAACPWLFVWDDHEVDNDYAGLQGQSLQTQFAPQRAAAYQACWEHLPLPKAMRPSGSEARIYGALNWGRLARILLLDDRQYRDPQACPKPGRGGSNTVARQSCPELAAPQRSLLGPTQERWLEQAWDTQRPWNLLAQQTLMAPFAWSDPAGTEGGLVWTDGWDGYAPARQRLLDRVAELKLPGAVVLGGDVHTHYVTELHRQPQDLRSPVVATEFCGTSISSLSLPQARIEAAAKFNPHVHYARGDARGYMGFTLSEQRLEARLMAVDDALNPESPVRVAARFVVEAGRPAIVKD